MFDGARQTDLRIAVPNKPAVSLCSLQWWHAR